MTKAADIRSEDGVVIVSTRALSGHIETAISHPLFNRGLWIVVETYAEAQVAEEGHAKWLRKMTGDSLPRVLHAAGAKVADDDVYAHPRMAVPAGVIAFSPAN